MESEKLEAETLCERLREWTPDYDDRTEKLLLVEAARRDAQYWNEDDALNVIAFLLAALTPPVDGGEFVMVPREATEAMLGQGADAMWPGDEAVYPDEHEGVEAAIRAVWAAMLAASPSRPSPSPEQRGFDAAVAAISAWADGFIGGAAPTTLRAAAKDLERNRSAILAALYPDRGE